MTLEWRAVASGRATSCCACAKWPQPVGRGKWNIFYASFLSPIALYRGQEDDAGKLVRRLQSERENFWLFLRQECVSATNNHAERLLRFAVLWRKSSLGTASEKGDR